MPPEKPAKIDLHIYRYQSLTTEQRFCYLGYMSELELQRLDSKTKAQSDRYIAERGVTRELLSNKLEQSPASIQFIYADKGKPLVCGSPVPLYFSQSHCHDLFVVAVSETTTLGVDVEAIKRSNNLERIAQYYFPQPEIDFLNSSSENLASRFASLWTSKESIGKLLGTGINKNLLKNATQLRQGKVFPNTDWLQKPVALLSISKGNHLISLAVQANLMPEINIAEENWQLV